MSLILALILATAATQQAPAPEIPVEVFRILELPVTVTDTTLVKTKNGYLLKCSLSNSSEFRQLGLRYSLAVVDSTNVTSAVVSRNEGLKLPPFQSKTVTFKTPLRLRPKGDERFVLMVEQVVSTDYIWEVEKPKDALEAYTKGDYSITPRVLRVLNAVDARFPAQVLH